MKKKIKPEYLNSLINKYPQVTSGRKNYNKQLERIKKNIELIKKYFKKNKI